VTVSNVKDIGTHVTVALSKSGEPEQTIKCQYVIACDGAKSPIRKSLGIGFTGETIPHGTAVIHYEPKSNFDVPRNELIFHLSSKGKGVILIGSLPKGFITSFELTTDEEKEFLHDEVDSHGFRKLKDMSEQDFTNLFKSRLGIEMEF
jgi:2-polyprenyl-6-methoxyphenol hydroxylase-like FAD-dependent oxidoreductase